MSIDDQRIVSSPSHCGGLPCFRGTRVPVHVVLEFLASGDTAEEVLREFPQLTHEDILAGLAFAARLAREETVSVSPAA